MSFNDDAQLDTSGVDTGGGGGGMSPGGMVAGGGGCLGLLGLLVVLALNMCSGGGSLQTQDDGSDQGTSQQQSQGGFQQDPGQFQGTSSDVKTRCRTGADANRYVDCRVIGTQNAVQAYWAKTLPEQADRSYTKARLELYQGRKASACGTASNQVGPFYCPNDKQVYIDASFFDELTSKFGADDGALAQEYVVAHEYGHHVQDILGLLDKAQQDPQGAQSGSVRTELMADCLAGMWVKDASTVPGPNGKPYLRAVTQSDINSALSAAKAVGDDHIQETMGSGQVNPESWTHGSSQAREHWFMVGYQKGSLQACNTFAVSRVE